MDQRFRSFKRIYEVMTENFGKVISPDNWNSLKGGVEKSLEKLEACQHLNDQSEGEE